MLSDKEYYEMVWDKYKKCRHYKNHLFYNKKFYKKKDSYIYLKKVAIFILVLVGSSGLVYGTSLIYKKNIIQKTANSNYSYTGIASEKYQELGFEFLDGFYYKKIYNYEEYEKTKQKLDSILEVDEKEFENNLLVIIINGDSNMKKMHVSEISADDTTLYIELEDIAKLGENDQDMLSLMINKNLDKDKLMILKKGYEMYSDDYMKIEELPEEYSIEEATKDNCVVINKTEINSNSLDNLKKFIEKTKNGEDSYIRIMRVENAINGDKDEIIITDIQYTKNKFMICIDQSRVNEKEFDLEEYYYASYTNIELSYDKNIGNTLKLYNSFDNDNLVVAYFK